MAAAKRRRSLPLPRTVRGALRGGRKTVHEVKVTVVRNSRPHRVHRTTVGTWRTWFQPICGTLKRLPSAWVRPARSKLDDFARDQAQTGCVALGAVVQQHLHAHAHAKQRLGRCGFQHGLLQARLTQFAHAVGHGALPRQHHALGSAHPSGREVTITVQPVPCAAACTACETDRRLPMP